MSVEDFLGDLSESVKSLGKSTAQGGFGLLASHLGSHNVQLFQFERVPFRISIQSLPYRFNRDSFLDCLPEWTALLLLKGLYTQLGCSPRTKHIVLSDRNQPVPVY